MHASAFFLTLLAFYLLCSVVTCAELNDIPFGSVSLSGITFGSVATYTCDDGYGIIGSVTRVCGADRKWSREEPVCEGFTCGSLDSPSNGEVSIVGTSIGAIATYSCFMGYILVGPKTRFCQTTGTWSDGAPICRGIL